MNDKSTKTTDLEKAIDMMMEFGNDPEANREVRAELWTDGTQYWIEYRHESDHSTLEPWLYQYMWDVTSIGGASSVDEDCGEVDDCWADWNLTRMRDEIEQERLARIEQTKVGQQQND